MEIVESIFTRFDDGNGIYYVLGKNGVEKIEEIWYNTEPHCAKVYWRIYIKGGIIKEVHKCTEVTKINNKE